jgi:predicted nucleic acid-binding protein
MGVAAAEAQTVTAAVCDASVLFKLVVAEADSDKAEALVNSTRVFVPEFVFLEVGNALWVRVSRGDMSSDEAASLLARLFGLGFEVRSIGDLARRALILGTMAGHPIYDCAYLALAEALGIPLVTADQRFLKALRRLTLSPAEVKPLSVFA